ncbi:hypothetical protein [Planktothricoides raciborskii]|uniref:Uncharacterized protein n=1 Tax=Planktothricoides raciborskii GIHE-MW2 TaxID=2792601 RepID=A0AAU8JDR8_9CYAN
MKSEYNLSQVVPEEDTALPCPYGHYPIYLEPDVEQFMTKIAKHKKIDVQVLVNDWLRSNIKLIQSAE